MTSVSVIIPCRNEETRIAACLESLLGDPDEPVRPSEILVVDGRSGDGTRAIVEEFAARDARVRLVDNPRRSAAAAMNIGIARAEGSIIVRADAHCIYPPGYVTRLVSALEEHGADNVGATLRTAAGDSSPRAAAIARALSHPFGVGTARFRIGTAVPREADTVPFGCFRREVFDRIGLFHEELEKDEDDELNARLIGSGGRVVLLPGLDIQYFARPTIDALWREYFGYGLHKPMALRLAGRAVSLRQFVPAIWVAFLALCIVWLVVAGSLPPAFYSLIAAYIVVACSIALVEALRHRSLVFGFWLAVAFSTMHLAYGIGYWLGAPQAGFLWKRENGSTDQSLPAFVAEISDPGERFIIEGRERAMFEALRAGGMTPLAGRRVLDVGCGTGEGLVRFRALGVANPAPVGVDINRERLVSAQGRGVENLVQADARRLPFADGAFDVVAQSTVFSSLRKAELRRLAAGELLRVLRPDGAILWYDFWWNPLNRSTRGVSLRKLRRLFKGCEIEARRVTLVPRLARPLARVNTKLAQAFELLWPLRTHYCALIRRPRAAKDVARARVTE